MRILRNSFVIALSVWAAASCKQSSPDVVPTALDSVGVVGTFVPAQAMVVDGKQARIAALAVDSAGNVYVADKANFLVRKISPAGVVTTLAGSGQKGYQNGPGATAKFGLMTGLAVDRRGNVYVSDVQEISCIRKISPDGRVSLFAGKPFSTLGKRFYTGASADAPDTSARFITILALTINTLGTLYASDIGSVATYDDSTAVYVHDAIRRITPDGNVRTLAGSVSGLPYQGRVAGGSPQPGYFLSLATNSAGNLVGVDGSYQTVFQITPNGTISELFDPQNFRSPGALLYDQTGNLLVASHTKIWRITPGGLVSVLAGSDRHGFVNDSLRLARFDGISALAVDATRLLYIADQRDGSVRRVRLR